MVPAFCTPEMKKPDSFAGSSATKLRTYLQQYKLIFLTDSSMFATNIRKTVYASSYLTGKAFKWIHPFLSNMSDDPDFLMNSWDLYEGQLLTLFGDPNELRNTENELESLYMKDSDNASSYIASFRSLESRLEGWSDRALMHSFRKGLPSRILDLLDQQPGDINTLSELVNATLKIDIRHEERVRERRRDNNFQRNDTNFRPAPLNRQMEKRPAPPQIVRSNPTQSTSQVSTSCQLVLTPAEI